MRYMQVRWVQVETYEHSTEPISAVINFYYKIGKNKTIVRHYDMYYRWHLQKYISDT